MSSAAGDRGIGQQDRELLPAVAADEVVGPQGSCAAPRRRSPGPGPPPAWPRWSLTCLKWSRSSSSSASGALIVEACANSPLQRVGDRPLVGQAGEPVGRGADLRDRQVAEVREDGRCLADGLADPLLVGLVVGGRAAEQHRADHLAADHERNAGRGAGHGGAHRAREQGRPLTVLAVRPARPDREARAGLWPRAGFSPSGEPPGSGVTDSSRSALLFLLRTTAVVGGRIRSRWRWRSRCASSSSLAICSVPRSRPAPRRV